MFVSTVLMWEYVCCKFTAVLRPELRWDMWTCTYTLGGVLSWQSFVNYRLFAATLKADQILKAQRWDGSAVVIGNDSKFSVESWHTTQQLKHSSVCWHAMQSWIMCGSSTQVNGQLLCLTSRMSRPVNEIRQTKPAPNWINRRKKEDYFYFKKFVDEA